MIYSRLPTSPEFSILHGFTQFSILNESEFWFYESKEGLMLPDCTKFDGLNYKKQTIYLLFTFCFHREKCMLRLTYNTYHIYLFRWLWQQLECTNFDGFNYKKQTIYLFTFCPASITLTWLSTLNMYVAANTERFIQLKLLVLQLTRYIIQSCISSHWNTTVS